MIRASALKLDTIRKPLPLLGFHFFRDSLRREKRLVCAVHIITSLLPYLSPVQNECIVPVLLLLYVCYALCSLLTDAYRKLRYSIR